jgi:two-component system NtrC family sensor kinase
MISAMNLADRVAMIIYDDTEDKPSLAKWGGKWNFNTLEELIPNLKITENVMKTGKVILDEEITEPGDPSPATNMENNGHFQLGFPLIANRKTMGVFCVGSDKPFKENRVSLLNAVAETISNAIYRQSMFDNLQVHLEALRTTKTQLVQSEKLAAIGELVAGVAHELNNPLTTISLSAELLLQQSVNEQDIYDLEKIVSESKRAAKIVRNLLDFARQRAPERKPVDINQLVKNTTDLVSWELVKNNISFQYELSDTLPITVADPNQLKQVFINIINNAIQAIKNQDKPGVIKIETQSGLSTFFGRKSSQEEMIRIIFTDNGPGIPPSILPRIFDPFFTTKKVSEGTGLGLSVCHGIIAEHKGHIWAEDASEGGARILIEIPVEHPETDNTAENDLKSLPTSAAEKILVIEDEDSVLEVTQRALMRKGYIVDGVSNGLEGLECLKGNSYSVIICDIRMTGMNGFEFYKEVNKINQVLAKRIIFTSGDSIKPEYTSFLKITGATFLPKPFELDHLLEVV